MDALTQEARELIAFYDERGWNWTSALAFVLTRSMFGRFRVCLLDEGEYITRHKHGRRTR